MEERILFIARLLDGEGTSVVWREFGISSNSDENSSILLLLLNGGG